MATSIEAVFALSKATGIPRLALEQRARRHRQLGNDQWANSGQGRRGRSAQHVQRHHLRYLLLGLAAEGAIDAPEAAAALSELRPDPLQEVETIALPDNGNGTWGSYTEQVPFPQPDTLLSLGEIIDREIEAIARHGNKLHLDVGWQLAISAEHRVATTTWMDRRAANSITRTRIHYRDPQPTLTALPARAPLFRQVIVTAQLLAEFGELYRDTLQRRSPALPLPNPAGGERQDGTENPEPTTASPAGKEEGPAPARASPSDGVVPQAESPRSTPRHGGPYSDSTAPQKRKNLSAMAGDGTGDAAHSRKGPQSHVGPPPPRLRIA